MLESNDIVTMLVLASEHNLFFKLLPSELFTISDYSRVEIWVKPTMGAKSIEISTSTSDTKYFEVGEELISGKWNLLVLDFTEIQGSLTQGDDLIVEVDDDSVWYFDKIKSVETTEIAFDMNAFISNDDTETANDGIQFITSGTDAFDIDPTRLVSARIDIDSTDRLDDIYIDACYADRNGDLDALPDYADFLTDLTSSPDLMALSGDGSVLYYVQNYDDQTFYRLDLLTGESISKSSADDITKIVTNMTGNYAAIVTDYRDKLYRYSYESNSTSLVDDYSNEFALQDNGNVIYEESDDDKYWYYDGSKHYIDNEDVRLIRTTKDPDIFFHTEYDTDDNEKHLYMSSVGKDGNWDRERLVTYDVEKFYVNDDITKIYLYAASDGFGDDWYVYDLELETLRELSKDFWGTVELFDNSSMLFREYEKEFSIYDFNTEETITVLDEELLDITNSDYVTNSDYDKLSFAKEAKKVIYPIKDENDDYAGMRLRTLPNSSVPERYLLSFDRKLSWYSYIEGEWTVVSTVHTPSNEDFLEYGMTKDQVNGLDASDFVKLYEDNREVVSLNVSAYFSSINRFTTPSLKGISVTTRRVADEISGETNYADLFTAKKEDIDAGSWRKIKRLYPIEIGNRFAEYNYYIKVGNDYKVFKNGTWTIIDAATSLADVEANWISIRQEAMSAEELRAIPEAALTSELAGNTFSIVYALKVCDQSTEGYTCNVNIDYVEDLFSGTSLTLSIYMYGDNTPIQYTTLTVTEIEDFMEWVNARQYNYGPIFYRIDNGSVSDFINYFMIKKVTVN